MSKFFPLRVDLDLKAVLNREAKLKLTELQSLKVSPFTFLYISQYDSNKLPWTDARHSVPRLWIRSAEVQGNFIRRMGTQQQQIAIKYIFMGR